VLDVVVVGGGPVGLYLGCLLARSGLSFAVLERRQRPGTHSRAIGIHPPALQAFQELGCVEAFLAAGVQIRRGVVRSETEVLGELSFASASRTFPFVLSLPQQQTETLLAEHLERIAPGTFQRCTEVTGLQRHSSHVDLTVQNKGNSSCLKAKFVVGADGCRSLIRSLTGLEYSGGTYTDTYLMGDFPETSAYGQAAVVHLMKSGVVEAFPLPGGLRRWVVRTAALNLSAQAVDLAALVQDRTGIHLPAGDCSMLSAFEVHHHAVPRMCAGRTVLIGDAAHEVSPIGGQGMNLGWLDAQALVPALMKAVRDPVQGTRAMVKMERRRLRSARIASRQAELNMSAGRPTSPAAQFGRELLLRGLLSRPVQPLLAQAFTMRWL